MRICSYNDWIGGSIDIFTCIVAYLKKSCGLGHFYKLYRFQYRYLSIRFILVLKRNAIG